MRIGRISHTRRMRLALVAAGVILAATPSLAQDVTAGRRVAVRACAACHGADGIAKLPEAANLAGQDATYLTRQLQAFQTGTRVHEQMSVIAKTLTEQQVSDVTAYYGAVQIEVVKVPGN